LLSGRCRPLLSHFFTAADHSFTAMLYCSGEMSLCRLALLLCSFEMRRWQLALRSNSSSGSSSNIETHRCLLALHRSIVKMYQLLRTKGRCRLTVLHCLPGFTIVGLL
jgi:hypothetical protein